ncbi:MAG TPA: cation-translocating P-type ATPase [Bacillota bacterium]|nr:cation-translocating P-type ATPase [Bacillota bacterium]
MGILLRKNEKLAVLIISGLLIGLAFLITPYSQTGRTALMIAAAVISGFRIAQTAIFALQSRVVSIQLLVTIAAVGGIAIGNPWEAAAVTFLFAFGGYLEARTIGKTREAIQQLLNLAPASAIVLRAGVEVVVEPEEVMVGETVVVRSGGKIPVDGLVSKGTASVNQAAITGESVPLDVSPRHKVFSGSLLEAGYLEITAERVGDDTTFARILHMVEEAQERKAPTQKFIERFARWYTPGIILLSLVVGVFTRNLHMALTLLVIGCPGALVISTPISMVAGIGNAARNGILVKGGEFLEKAGKVTVVAFDKTGTLTQGRPALTGLTAIGISEQELLRMAASVEKGSEHHIGRAIVAGSKATALAPVEDVEVYAGGGIRGLVGGQSVLVGNRRLFGENKIAVPNSLEEWMQERENQGETPVLVACDGATVGSLSIADTLRPEAAEAVAGLQRAGKRVIMLTGDNPRTARATAEKLRLDDFRAQLLPEDKVKAIQELRASGAFVAMVGDGINDTPALAESDLGIAMGAAGTDAAIETADLALMSDNLAKVTYAFQLGKATLANIRQNVAFAVAVVFLLVIGVLGQKVFLATGMLAHEASVMLVILNALRLRTWKGN